MPLIRIRPKKAKTTTTKFRKGFLSVAVPWLKRFGKVLFALVVLGWLGAWVYFTDAHKKAGDWVQHQIVMASASMGLEIENIFIEGRDFTDADVILALMNVQKGDPLFSVSPKDAQDLLTQIEWVRAAHVERRLPNTLYIRIEERQPIAFIQKDGALDLIDRSGNIIHDRQAFGRFKSLPIVMGAGAAEAAPGMLSALDVFPLVRERLETGNYISQRRWDLKLNTGTLLKLPETGGAEAFALLRSIHEREGLLDKDLVHIDLREKGRIIVQTKPGGVQEYKASLKNGSNI